MGHILFLAGVCGFCPILFGSLLAEVEWVIVLGLCMWFLSYLV